MTINALFGAGPNRENRGAGSAQGSNDNSTFAASLAALTREVQEGRANTAAQASTPSASGSTSASSSTPGSGSATGTSNSGSSPTVLGSDADGLSQLAADGVTVTLQSIAGLNLPTGMNPSSAAYQQDLFSALQKASSSSHGDTLSQSTFSSLIEKSGGTQAQADQLFSLLGGDETGTVSNAQMLHALGALSGDPTSPTSQMLLGLMDSNHNGVVSSSEFTQFETAMVDEERGTSV